MPKTLPDPRDYKIKTVDPNSDTCAKRTAAAYDMGSVATENAVVAVVPKRYESKVREAGQSVRED